LAWKIDLSPDALDGLYAVPPGPPVPLRLRLWTWLCDRMPLLRRYRGSGEIAPVLPVADERKAELLSMLCDAEVREAVLTILAPGVRAIKLDESRRAEKK